MKSIVEKTCTKCGQTKLIEGFYIRKNGKYVYPHERCKDCVTEYRRNKLVELKKDNEKYLQWRDKRTKYQKEYMITHPELAESKRAYCKKIRESGKGNEYQKAYYHANIEKMRKQGVERSKIHINKHREKISRQYIISLLLHSKYQRSRDQITEEMIKMKRREVLKKRIKKVLKKLEDEKQD